MTDELAGEDDNATRLLVLSRFYPTYAGASNYTTHVYNDQLDVNTAAADSDPQIYYKAILKSLTLLHWEGSVHATNTVMAIIIM
jgi:hypothetical protein